MTCGIYRIYWGTNIYIGKSQHIEERFKKHLYMLKTGKHHNYLMNIYYSRYGLPELEILEECSREELDAKEIEYITKFDSFNNGLNLTKGGEGSYLKDPEHYLPTLELLVDNKLKHYEISEITGLSCNIVSLISSKHTSYRWLKEVYPDLWDKLENRCEGEEIYLIKEGVIEKVTSRVLFENTHNISSSHLSRLISGDIKSTHGWHKCDKEGNLLYTPPPKNVFYFVKEGIIEKVTKLAEFSDKYNLDRSGLTKVTKGKLKSIKGWRLCDIDGKPLI